MSLLRSTASPPRPGGMRGRDGQPPASQPLPKTPSPSVEAAEATVVPGARYSGKGLHWKGFSRRRNCGHVGEEGGGDASTDLRLSHATAGGLHRGVQGATETGEGERTERKNPKYIQINCLHHLTLPSPCHNHATSLLVICVLF